jgi:hypothetical protein
VRDVRKIFAVPELPGGELLVLDDVTLAIQGVWGASLRICDSRGSGGLLRCDQWGVRRLGGRGNEARHGPNGRADIDQAAWRYSWIKPPNTSTRSTNDSTAPG